MSDPRAIGRRARAPLVVRLFVLSLAAPPEAAMQLGALRLSGYRIVLLAAFLPALARVFSRRAGPFSSCDALMLFHGLWAALALAAWGGAGAGVESGGIYLVESTGAYLLARAWIRTADEMRATARVFLSVVLTMLLFTVVEAVTGLHLLRELARAVLGGPSLPVIERRLGLARAFGSFEHPILYGMFCAAALGMSLYALDAPGRALRGRARTAAVFLATFVSVSSGALAAAMVQILLAGWDHLARAIRGRWRLLFSVFGGVWAAITLSSNRGPMKVFLTYFTFNPGTAYNRLRIWDYGTAEVHRHPLLGIGLGEWERPAWMVSGSMDNFWLATAVRYGVPAFASLFLVMLWIGFASARGARAPGHARLRMAWLMSVTGLALGGSTVHYWNALLSLFCFLLGLGAWLTSTPAARGSVGGTGTKAPAAAPGAPVGLTGEPRPRRRDSRSDRRRGARPVRRSLNLTAPPARRRRHAACHRGPA